MGVGGNVCRQHARQGRSARPQEGPPALDGNDARNDESSHSRNIEAKGS